MGTYPPRVRRDVDVGPRGNSQRALTIEPQRISNHPVGLGFHTMRNGFNPRDLRFRARIAGVVCGAVSTRGITVSSQGCRTSNIWKFYDAEMGPYPPGALALCANTGKPAMGRWGWGFPHRAGRCRPGGTPFLSLDCRSYICMEGFVIRGWEPSAGCADSMHESQTISDRPVGLGFPHP